MQATTVGFGDYCPNSWGGKVFTLFFAPFAVIFTAGAIEKVALVPLNAHQEKVEEYVLDEFGQHITTDDFQDIRRLAGLRDDEDIRGNDFLLAMLLRLGRVHDDDLVKARRLFSKLDNSGDGVLNTADIDALILDPPDTSHLCDKTFDAHASPSASPRTPTPTDGGGGDDDYMDNPLKAAGGSGEGGPAAAADGDQV
eukprot:SAG22_NODE_833_length_6929_cov_27.036159_3_plen_197_part_00